MVTTGALNECFIDTFDSFHVLLIHWYVDFSCCCCLVASVMSDRLCVTLWTVACQAPLSMGFSRQEYRSGLLCSATGDLPDSGIEPVSLMAPALTGEFFTTGATWGAQIHTTLYGIEKQQGPAA